MLENLNLEGINIENFDQEILRLENIIRTGIEPRIPSCNTHRVPLRNTKSVLVIRVGRSWIAPHRVILGGHDKFYSRSSNGKYPLDVGELRIAFNLSETITERIRNFRIDRISKILANETPVPIADSSKIVLHMIPITSFNPAQSYDLREIAENRVHLFPMGTTAYSGRYNLDGFMTHLTVDETKSYSYTQLFRNGILESVNGYMLRRPRIKKIIPSIAFEKVLIDSLREYLTIFKSLNVELPVFIFISLLEVSGYSMGIDSAKYWIDDVQTIDRDMLMLPEVIIQNYEDETSKILKPCFDSIWNACGFSKDLYYNDKGEWAPPR